MGQKLAFCIGQYALLALFCLSIVGWGRLATAKLLAAANTIPTPGVLVLQATTGLGLVTLCCILIASLGALTAAPLLVIVAIGIALSLPALRGMLRNLLAGLRSVKIGQSGRAIWMLFLCAVIAFLSQSLVRPLSVPLGWDEVAYHLPTAQAWAESGRLVVTDWLRFPLFPFNMEVLYAGALVLGNDITAHLLHALTGFLAIALIYAVARTFVPAPFALLASILVVYTIKVPLKTADVDIGLMLYTFSAFATLLFCYLEQRRRLCLLAAFFIGLALGTKYQAMFYLPALALGFLLVERDWKLLCLAALVALATACFWYVRNFIVSGDPIHPLGGSIFGYWLWNADDIRGTFLDLDRVRNLPPWYLWPSVGSVLFWRSSAPVAKACMLVSVVAVGVWFAVSGYDRYLMAMYPLLAILSSYCLYRLITQLQIDQRLASVWSRFGRRTQTVLVGVVLLAIIYDWGKSTIHDISDLVLPDSTERAALLQQTYPGVELITTLDQPLYGTLYQLGFEDEIYYLGTPVLGDHFGKDRYNDVTRYVGQAAQLSQQLRTLGASYLLVNLGRHPTFMEQAIADARFADEFELLGQTPRAVLYRVKAAPTLSAARVMHAWGKPI
jgi:hypothetical protein